MHVSGKASKIDFRGASICIYIYILYIYIYLSLSLDFNKMTIHDGDQA